MNIKAQVVGLLILNTITPYSVGRANEPATNATFSGIVGRVKAQDPWTSAITEVAPLPDAPATVGNLDFAIESTGVVTLSKKEKGKRVIYEQYYLRMDERMRYEYWNYYRLLHLTRMIEAPDKEKRAQEIERVSKGKLKFGMSLSQVEQEYGRPQEVRQLGGRAYDDLEALYPEFRLFFVSHMLISATPKK
ncbi:MAG TPA: hypothetical protein VF681_01450 [Abditibacteriaceae bacterium]|jgi:hypothetical protein